MQQVKDQQKTENINIIHFNIRSIGKNFDELHIMIEES